ncbi:MAG: glycosyltransferase [Methylobacteriaceae bacterium]|jgi:glycosyltransferase involved in cell wall biosynthesis|nr:glycosyltransferase [Methylobacteriaceae bacterium]
MTVVQFAKAKLKTLAGIYRQFGPSGLVDHFNLRDALFGKDKEDPYVSWVRKYDTLSVENLKAVSRRIAGFTLRPKISVVVSLYNTQSDYLEDMFDSVLNQLYPEWELSVVDDASVKPHVFETAQKYAKRDSRIKIRQRAVYGGLAASLNDALDDATGDYVAFLGHGDILAPHALYMIAEWLNKTPDAEILYSDEDKLDAGKRRYGPLFKPDWNCELFNGQYYTNHLLVIKRALIEAVGRMRAGFEGSQDYDLLLRALDRAKRPPVHIPFILYHWRVFPGVSTFSSDYLEFAKGAARRAIRESFERRGEQVDVIETGGFFQRVVRPAPVTWPRVSAIVSTDGHAEALEASLKGLQDKTDYPDLEIIVADSENRVPDGFGQHGVQVVGGMEPGNRSAALNRAAEAATGSVLLLLSTDVAVSEPNWLKEMIVNFSDPEVAVIGAKLLYRNNTLRHGGMLLGVGGCAGSFLEGAPSDYTGVFGYLGLARDVSCVAGDCLVIRKAVFDEVQGVDAEHLKGDFSDVDLCLKVRRAGYRILWTPFATLYYGEARNRAREPAAANRRGFRPDAAYLQEKWGETLLNDPFFSPNLSLKSTAYEFAFPPRIGKPWVE